MLQAFERLNYTHASINDSITLDQDTRKRSRIKSKTDGGTDIGIFVERGHPLLVGEVLKVMRGLAEEGRTMIVVTHEMSFARDVSNHVIYLHEGVIEEQGNPKVVFDNPSSERMKQFLSPKY